MDEIKIRSLLIPKLKEHVKVPVIEGNQYMEPPESDHIVFNWIANAKDIGMESIEYGTDEEGNANVTYSLDYRSTLSLTSVCEVTDTGTHSQAKDKSYNLAQLGRQWFTFIGRSYIIANGIAVVEVTGIQSRDSINEEEYRRGFDVSLRYRDVVTVPIDYFTKIYVQQEGEL